MEDKFCHHFFSSLHFHILSSIETSSKADNIDDECPVERELSYFTRHYNFL